MKYIFFRPDYRSDFLNRVVLGIIVFKIRWKDKKIVAKKSCILALFGIEQKIASLSKSYPIVAEINMQRVKSI